MRRPILLIAANVIATIVGVVLLVCAVKSTGLSHDVPVIGALILVFPAGAFLTLVLLIVAGVRREEPWWAYVSPIAVLAVPLLLLLPTYF